MSQEDLINLVNGINAKQVNIYTGDYASANYYENSSMNGDITVSANRIMQLPGATEWELPCKWESIRKLLVLKFAKKEYSEWDDYKPNEAELSIFRECRDVARAFEQQLQIEMQQ